MLSDAQRPAAMPRHAVSPLHPVAREDQPKRTASRCSSCSMRAVCMPSNLSTEDFARLDAMICTTRHVRRGEALFRSGDAFHSIYAVRTGSFKTVMVHRDGNEQVTGFQIVGEVLGLDGLHGGHHNGDAIALEDSTVCIIPFGQLEQLCREVRPMQQHVYQMMGGEIVRESSLMLLLGTMTAEQRVAAFLLNLSARFKARGYSSAEFVLRMTRDEIGEYLGMKLETVSRMLSKFQRSGMVATRGKQIRIVDADGLARI
ncbi:fumarate/nitrate reduction transcriptional regulator Fnr [Burkholderia sp. Bp9002]|nr:fumarate/nitrate reduction transcriptional regulator Fnr [Burkholderia sp. Bp9002]